MMKRREFILRLAGAAAWPLAARAQEPAMPVVGVLRVNAKDVNEAFAEPFPRYMKALGWEQGRSIGFQFLWAGGQNDQLPVLAHELVARKVNLIITFGNPAVQAVFNASSEREIETAFLTMVERRA